MQIVRSTIAAPEILGVIRDNYGDCPPDARCMFEYRGVNDVYRYVRRGVSLFFKIYARNDLDRDAIQAEVDVVNHLRQSGLSVAYPIEKLDGDYLVSLNTPEGTRYGALFSEAEGSPCDNDALGDRETTEIGRLLSDMHSKLDTMTVPVKRWRLDDRLFIDLSMDILERHGDSHPIDLPFLWDVAKEIRKQIHAQADDWKWGLCHGDVYAGNIHQSENGRLTLYDFDFCGYGWRAYDVSPFLGAFGWGTGDAAIDKRKRRLEHFLRGYESAGGFTDSEVEAVFKVFVPFRRIFNMGYLYDALLYVWGNRFRNVNIDGDMKLLKEWIAYYWR